MDLKDALTSLLRHCDVIWMWAKAPPGYGGINHTFSKLVMGRDGNDNLQKGNLKSPFTPHPRSTHKVV